ncbi:MAG: cation-translocating P-type ATPase [Bacteroidota bacterium]
MENHLLPERGLVIAAQTADVYALLNSSPEGLSRAEAAERLVAFGPNVVARYIPYPVWKIALDQIASPIIYVLLVAAGITFALKDYSDAGIIMAVVIINALIGFVQELKATRAMEALRELATTTAQVRRSGVTQTVPGEELAPGDVALLEAGMRIPADMRLVRSLDLLVDESQLTGESLPVHKQIGPLPETRSIPAEIDNMAFAGSMVLEGRAEGVVYATGSRSELGQIAQAVAEVEHAETPLQLRLKQSANLLALGMFALTVITMGIGLLRGMPVLEIFLAAVALAVSVMPEGLPVVVTVVLSVGVRQMAARHVLVRKLAAAETMGAVDVICTDKTGTITLNHMTVQMVVWGPYQIQVRPEAPLSCPEVTIRPDVACPASEEEGLASLHEVLKLAVLCNNAEYQVSEKGEITRSGSPTEVALLEAAATIAPDLLHFRDAEPPSSEVPFNSARKFMATLQPQGEGLPAMYVKGAPEVVVPLCTRQWSPGTGEAEALDRERWVEIVRGMAREGQRVIAVACREWQGEAIQPHDVADLTLYGLIGMTDPPRPEAAPAIQGCRKSGIRVIMVTGDHPATGAAIARQVGLLDHHRRDHLDARAADIVSGEELAAMDNEQLTAELDGISVFARVTPRDKLRVVEQLQGQGHIVAVTGDGVNDAPALRRADIGVAMGKGGTEAAREAADVVLLDDSFASIYEAVKVGRYLFESLRRVVFFLLSSGAGETVAILGALAIGLPLPFTAAQILWINLVTNGLQDVALAFEPGEDFVVRRAPRGPHTRLFDRIVIFYTALVGWLFGLGSLWVFRLYWSDSAHLALAQTAATTAMVMFQIFHALSCRSLVTSIFRMPPFSNPWAVGAFIAGTGAQLLFVYWAPLQGLFRTVPLGLADWGIIIGLALAGVLIMELGKMFVRRRRWHLG